MLDFSRGLVLSATLVDEPTMEVVLRSAAVRTAYWCRAEDPRKRELQLKSAQCVSSWWRRAQILVRKTMRLIDERRLKTDQGGLEKSSRFHMSRCGLVLELLDSSLTPRAEKCVKSAPLRTGWRLFDPMRLALRTFSPPAVPAYHTDCVDALGEDHDACVRAESLACLGAPEIQFLRWLRAVRVICVGPSRAYCVRGRRQGT
jgi:hypothetical protein